MRRKNQQMGLRVAVLFILVLLLPTVTAQDPPVEDDEQKACIAYAYTESENHYFLIKDNSSVFGNSLKIVHNCKELEVYADGFFSASSSENFSLSLEAGLHNIELRAEGFNETFNDVMFYPDRLNWEFDFIALEESKPQFIDVEISELRTNWAVGVGIVVVWVLTTYVYWSLISSYIDRNFIEEVTQ